MENQIIEVGGLRWKVRYAKTLNDAMNAIASARCSGSVGEIHEIDRRFVGGGTEIIADVVQINSDGTERQPYAEPY